MAAKECRSPQEADISVYVKALHAEAAAEQAADEERQRQEKAKAARDRLTPLEDRLARLLATIPEEVQREGLSLPSLQKALKGHWRGSCHPGALGAALRKLGYERRRNWRGRDGFSARWYPQSCVNRH